MAEEETTNIPDETPDAAAPEATVAQSAPEPPPASGASQAVTAPSRTAPAARREPDEVIAPSERRRRARAAKATKAGPREPRSAEARHAERVADRGKKAEHRRTGRAKARTKSSASAVAVTAPREHTPGVQQVRQGVVVSDKADKTITVRVDSARRHRRYQKIVRTSRTLHAHDETNDANIGDTVIVREARPLSRTKRWRLISVLERAK